MFRIAKGSLLLNRVQEIPTEGYGRGALHNAPSPGTKEQWSCSGLRYNTHISADTHQSIYCRHAPSNNPPQAPNPNSFTRGRPQENERSLVIEAPLLVCFCKRNGSHSTSTGPVSDLCVKLSEQCLQRQPGLVQSALYLPFNLIYKGRNDHC